MELIFCPNCQKLTGFKRALGFGTLFATVLTAGLWLLAIPFYPKRCMVCGFRKSDSVPWYRTWRFLPVLALAIFTVSTVLTKLAPGPGTQHPATILKGPNYNDLPGPTSRNLNESSAEQAVQKSPSSHTREGTPLSPEEEHPSYEYAEERCLASVLRRFPGLECWPAPADTMLGETARKEYLSNNRRITFYVEFLRGTGVIENGSGFVTCTMKGSTVKLESVQLGIFSYKFDSDGNLVQ